MEVFDCGVKILMGAGAVSALGALGGRRMLLVTEPALEDAGEADRVARLARCQAYEILTAAEATWEGAEEGAGRLRSLGADFLVMLGGEHVLELGKAIGCFSGGECRMAAIPTTSGSGAEVRPLAVLRRGRERAAVKVPRPETVILDSDFLRDLTKKQIAEGGFQILAHALEACAARGAGMLSGLWAREAAALAYGALPASFAGNLQVRLKIHLASTMAGMACAQAGLGLCQAMVNALEDRFRVSRGQLMAILLPEVVAINAGAAGRQYWELARAAGLGGGSETAAVQNWKAALLRLGRELKLPQTLAQAGIPTRQLWDRVDEIALSVLRDPCCRSNPVAADDFLVRRLLERVSGRR